MMKIQNTLKTLGLLSLSFNMNAANTLKASDILVEKTLITSIKDEEKKLNDSIKKFEEEKKKDDKLKFEYKTTLKVKNGDKTEDKEYELKSLEDAKSIVKEVKEKIEFAELPKDDDKKSSLRGDNFNPFSGNYTTPIKNDKDEYDTEYNKTKIALTTGYVLIVGALTYFGINKYNNSSEATTVDVQ
jgi:hypothetical protein